MARPAGGHDVLEQAKAAIAKAKTVEELRAAQAVVLPLDFGLSLAQTADAIGVSLRWVTELRNRYRRIALGQEAPKPRRGGRQRQNLTPDQETEFLTPFFESAKTGGVLVAGPVHQALEGRLGRKVALSSVYNLLHRHGWRKLAPDKRHVKSDPEAQAAWKKKSPRRLPPK